MITCDIITNNNNRTTLTMNTTRAEINLQAGHNSEHTSRIIAFLKWVVNRDEPKQYKTTLRGCVEFHTIKDKLHIQLINPNNTLKFSYHESEMSNWKNDNNQTIVVALIQ